MHGLERDCIKRKCIDSFCRGIRALIYQRFMEQGWWMGHILIIMDLTLIILGRLFRTLIDIGLIHIRIPIALLVATSVYIMVALSIANADVLFQQVKPCIKILAELPIDVFARWEYWMKIRSREVAVTIRRCVDRWLIYGKTWNKKLKMIFLVFNVNILMENKYSVHGTKVAMS